MNADTRRSTRTIFLVLIANCLLLNAFGQTRDLASWVNPFIGTGGHGHTFPGATMPFGMVQLSPDTRIDNWDGSSGYHYSDNIIYGFSHTHLSGTGIPDGCDILLMPTLGEMAQLSASAGDKSVNGYASKFSHANERAEAGYYSVRLDDDGIDAEMTATKRVGFHRYTFPVNGIATLMVDLEWRDKLIGSTFRVVSSNRVEGYRRSSSWAKDQVVYFVAEFSEPLLVANISRGYGSVVGIQTVYKNSKIVTDRDQFSGRIERAALQFKIPAEKKLSVKVAISSVSIEGARKNLEAELPGWDFEKVRADARAAWNKELSKIEVSGGTDAQTTTFYTALYHTMIQPNVFNDVDGNYRGLDGKVHQLPGYSTSGGVGEGRSTGANPKSEIRNPKSEQYTVFSLWDTFRAAHPLYTIIDQKRTVDFINTFTRQYEQGGRLPVWELWGEETDTMIGYHAVSVIADAMAKGIKGFDYEKAYAAAKHSAELDHFGLAAYKKRGYISMEDENESVSRTLEYAYDDWCIARMAEILLDDAFDKAFAKTKALETYRMFSRNDLLKDRQYYLKRARSFENLFDTKTDFFRPKKNGGFVEPFAPNAVTFGFTEGNSWQYSFFAPQNVPRMMDLYGGPEKFAAKLDELFTTDQKLAGREQADLTGLIGQYAHGNEPSHHIAYLYNYAGQPWKTQKVVRKIMGESYKPTPDGLIGNEDCGQMSAWYVMSALGLYEVAPGSPEYALGSPLFEKAVIHLENGRTFTINAPGAGRMPYVRSIRSDARTVESDTRQLNLAFFPHSAVMEGGALNFEMSATPVKTAMAEPYRVGDVLKDHDTFVAVPVIRAGKQVFHDSIDVTFDTVTDEGDIHYTLDGSTPTASSARYDYKPIRITKTTNVKAIAIGAYNKGKGVSPVAEATFSRRPNDWTVKVLSGYSTQYTGGGENGIVDGIRGTVNFASGEWQGIQGKPYEAVVDLQKETEIRELGASFLQVASPWIWMPANIKFEISNNRADWTEAASIKTDVPVTDMRPQIKEFRQAISPAKARYVRIRAFNIGKIPAWHPGAGGDPWIFIDEVFIK